MFPTRALKIYRNQGRIHEGENADAVRDRLVSDWWVARQAGGAALMIAARRREVAELNHRARVVLRHHGRLGSEVVIGDRSFAVGDEVLALHNDYRLGVLNGTRATVVGVDATARRLSARTVDGDRVVEFPRGYIEAGHLTHGYATTIHKAQGATVHRGLIVGDDALAREPVYSALSRGAERNDVYVLGAPRRAENHPQPVDGDDRWDELLAAVERTLSQRLALDQLPDATLLAAEKRGLERQLRERPPDRSAELRDLAAQRQQLLKRLAAVEMRTSSLEDELVRLGGLRRFTRRHDRHDALRQVARTVDQLSEIRRALSDLGEQQATLCPDQDRYNAWTVRHRTELDRLRTIGRLERITEREPSDAKAREITAKRDSGLGVDISL